jgi:hypothetical protein
MKKTVIKFNESGFDSAITRMHQAAKLVSKFLHGYDKFQDQTEMDALTQSTLLKVLRGHRGEVERMIDTYVSDQKRPLMKYYQEACYNALIECLDPIFRELALWRDLGQKDGMPNHLLDAGNWPINNELDLVIDEAFKDDLRSYFELSIESDTDQKLWELYEKLRLSFNEFHAFAETNELIVPKTFNQLFGVHPQMPITNLNGFPGSCLPSRSKHWKP